MKRLKYLTAINPPLPRDRVPLPNDMVSFLPMERIGEDGSLDLSEVRPSSEVSQGYTAILDGDLVIAKITPCFENGKGAVCLGLQGGVGFGTTELIVLRTKPQSDSRFLYWLTRSHEFRNWGEAEMRGSAGQKRVTEEFVSNFLTIELNNVEQRRIAAYLDEQTEKIDRLMDMRRRQMALLKEQRSALIQQAVTRGLNPNVPMKDSGLPWLGEIPEHWEVKRLKFITPQVSVGIVINPSSYYVASGVPCLRSLNVKPGELIAAELVFISEKSHLLLKKSAIYQGDVVAVRTGQPGTTAVVDERFHNTNCIDLIIIRRSSLFISEYIQLLLNSSFAKSQFDTGSDGAIQQHFNIQMAENLVILLPFLREQQEIREYIRNETSKFETLHNFYDRQLTLLTEYRAALIHECVTGQRLIPEAASL